MATEIIANSRERNKAQASLIENVIIGIIIVIVFIFFVRPQSSLLSQKRTELAQLQTESQSIQQQKDSLAQLVNKVHQSADDIALVDEALPLVSRPTQLQLLMDGLVKASGMKTTEITFQQTADVVAGNKALLANPFGVDRKLKTSSFGLTVNGSMDQFKNLLQLIETNGRIIDIAGIDMSSDQASITFKLKLKAYSYAP